MGGEELVIKMQLVVQVEQVVEEQEAMQDQLMLVKKEHQEQLILEVEQEQPVELV